MWKKIFVLIIPLCFGNPIEKCSHPTTPYTCASILDYLHCLGPSSHVQDCKQTDEYIYWRVDNQLPWDGALAACEGIDNGNLASIHNFQETVIVNELKEAKAIQTDVWMGLHCSGTCSGWYDFVWIDGTPVDYNKFDLLAGDFNIHKCGRVFKYHPSGGSDTLDTTWWDNQDCNNQYISICKVAIK